MVTSYGAMGGRRHGNDQSYQPVSLNDDEEEGDSLTADCQWQHSKSDDKTWKQDLPNCCRLRRLSVPIRALGVLLVGAILLIYWTILILRHSEPASCDTWQRGFTCSPKISQFWGQYSPYFNVPSEISSDVPDQCQVTFAQVLSRHGARDPTYSKTRLYEEIIKNIQSRATSYSKDYEFIKGFKYTLGADQLSVFGENQMINSGIQFYYRYQDLAREATPFIRSAGKDRVVQSAQNWTQGFHGALLEDIPYADDNYPYSIVVISESDKQNNTLNHGLCTVFEDLDFGTAPQQEWVDVFTPPITARLNENMPGSNLSSWDTISIMDLCPFVTVASPTGELSPFCSLFNEDEWESYNYFQSLGKYYGYGWGNPLGATQGVGFTNELISRLTGTPVSDHTSTNHSLDDSKDTFPIGGNTVLYADFSHDNDLTSIFSAMGLYNETQPLLNQTLETINETKGYSAAWTVPFAARAYFEKMRCAGEAEEYVRILVNGRVLPLNTCGGDELGRCRLSSFVESLSFARSGGNWDRCFL